MYVTFQFRPHPTVKYSFGVDTKKYAIKCETIDEAHEIMADVYSLDGVSYIRLNKCGKIPKGPKVVKITDRL